MLFDRTIAVRMPQHCTKATRIAHPHQMVADYQIGSPDFKARVAGSKFKQWPQFATGKTGYIALQNHGDAVAFQNLKIRVLK